METSQTPTAIDRLAARCQGNTLPYPPLPRTAVLVETGDYRHSHGTEPRGRGGWLFCTVDPRRGDYLDHMLPCIGGTTYGEAKKAAKAFARERGLDTIWVCA